MKSSNNISINYNFNKFIKGPSNLMAYKTCNDIIKNPGKKYNPLFISSLPGLGKTHLLKGMKTLIKSIQPKIKIIYITAEQWVNQYIEAIKNKSFIYFRKEYRMDCDILLIDNIQFFANKNSCQSEFFHTISYLYQTEKQVVFTSNQHPGEISGFTKTLKNEFRHCSAVVIKPPQFPTRLKILKQKSKENHLFLKNETLKYIANHITLSIRELESIIIKLKIFNQIYKIKNLPISIIKDYLNTLLNKTNVFISIDKICHTVAKYYNLTIFDLKSKSRLKKIVQARQIAMNLCKRYSKLSLKEIGNLFGQRDHTTVLFAINKFYSKTKINKEKIEEFNKINQILNKR